MDELRIKNDILQKKNEELEAEIRALKYERANLVDSMAASIKRQKEDHKILSEKIKSFIKKQSIYTDALREVIDISELELSLTGLEISSADKEIEIQDREIKRQASTIEKHTKAPRINKQNTDALWEPYIQKFDAYIADGKTESWAKNKIGELMEKDGVWKKVSKKGTKKIITRPDRATLHRQLVTNRK